VRKQKSLRERGSERVRRRERVGREEERGRNEKSCASNCYLYINTCNIHTPCVAISPKSVIKPYL